MEFRANYMIEKDIACSFTATKDLCFDFCIYTRSFQPHNYKTNRVWVLWCEHKTRNE